jgi:hypothetical protein
MNSEDHPCVEKLQKTAKRILTQENTIKKESTDQRILLWNEVLENYNKYLDKECGGFLGDLDNFFRGEFNAALLILAISFTDNGESFTPAERFSENEREAYKKITEYNVFESRTPAGIRKKLELQNDETLARWYDDYQGMKKWVDTALKDAGVDEHIRCYLNNKWNEYCRNVDKALNQDRDRWIHRIMEYKKQQEIAVTTENEKRDRALEEKQKLIEERLREQKENDDRARAERSAEDQKLQERENNISEKEKEIERIRQQWNKVEASSSRFVRLADAKQYEMNFIGRTGLKVGKVKNQIEIRGRIFIVDEITHGSKCSIEECLSQIKRRLTPNEKQNLPENRYLTARLVEKKWLGAKERYTFRALFFSRPEKYAEFGFDTEPLTLADINPALDDAQKEAKRIGETVFLCIASPTGFEPDLHTFTDGEAFHKRFISHDLSVCFIDLETATILINPHDLVAASFLPLCEIEIDLAKTEKVKRILYPLVDDRLLIQGYAEYLKVLEQCQKESGITDEGLIKKVFYQYGTEKELPVRYVKDVGLVIMK